MAFVFCLVTATRLYVIGCQCDSEMLRHLLSIHVWLGQSVISVFMLKCFAVIYNLIIFA